MYVCWTDTWPLQTLAHHRQATHPPKICMVCSGTHINSRIPALVMAVDYECMDFFCFAWKYSVQALGKVEMFLAGEGGG
jgi:hypothetical protein